MAGIMKSDAYQSPYADKSTALAELMKEVGGLSGMDAIVKVLRMKRREQEKLVDKNMFAMAAKTGAGKSTFMIYHLYKNFLEDRGRKGTILCTQPLVGLATSNASSLSAIFHPAMRLGKNVGYYTGKTKLFPTDSARIIYCTTMELANFMLKKDPQTFSHDFPVIVVDEAHDQSLEMLLVLSRVKKYIRAHPDLSTIFLFASATIHPPMFVEYLGGDPKSPYNTCYIEGSTPFPIEERFVPSSERPRLAVEEAVKLTVEHYKSIVARCASLEAEGKKPTHFDILCMWDVPSHIQRYLEAAKVAIEEANAEQPEVGKKAADSTSYFATSSTTSPTRWSTVYISYDRIDANFNTVNRQNLFRPPLPRQIRVIGSTPAIQVGATLPNLAVIIETGKIFSKVPFPLTRADEMMFLPIAEDARTQRIGRVGRTGPGIAHALYPRETKEAMLPMAPPSTLTNISVPSRILEMTVLSTMETYAFSTEDLVSTSRLLALRRTTFPFPTVDIINYVDLMQPISMDMYIRAMRRLTAVGLLSKEGSLLPIGIQVSALKAAGVAFGMLAAALASLHPFDIALLSAVGRESLQSAEISSRIEWRNTQTTYYPKLKTKIPFKPEDLITVYVASQDYVNALSEGKGDDWTPHPNTTKKGDAGDVKLDVNRIRATVGDLLDNYDPFTALGAFYAPLISEMSPDERKEAFSLCLRALQSVSDRFGKEGIVDSGEIKLL